MKSMVVTLAGTEAAPTATAAPATLTDIFTTAISTTESLTGVYKIIQEGLLVAGGMAWQSKKMGGSFNPFAS